MKVPDIKDFQKYKETSVVKTEHGDILFGVVGAFFKRAVGKREESIGIFSHKGKILYCAWGWRGEPHCSVNAVMGDDGAWLEACPGCPDIRVNKNDMGIITGFFMKTGMNDEKFFDLSTPI